jgi:lipopolysaccharide export LptBFGC system permease protein LptF
MWILDRYILREIVKTFFVAFGVFTLVFLLAAMYELLRRGMPPELILKNLPFALGNTAPYLVPISLGIACALTFGRLSADNEVLPLLAGGLHPRTILWPGLFVGLVVSVLMYGVQATLVPYCYYRKKTIKLMVLEELLALPDGEDKVLLDGRRGFFFYAKRCRDNHLEGVELVWFPALMKSANTFGGGSSSPGRIEIVAERGRVVQAADKGILVELEEAVVTAFALAKLPSFGELDVGGTGALGEAEWARLAPQITGLPSLRSVDGDGDGSLSRHEVEAFRFHLDPTARSNESFWELSQRRTVVKLAPQAAVSFKVDFLTTPEVLSYRASVSRWLAGAGEEESLRAATSSWASSGGSRAKTPEARAGAAARGREAAEAYLARHLVDRVALAAALAGGAVAPGAGPGAPLSVAALAATAPGSALRREGRLLERNLTATFHKRLVLSLAPFLFALISVLTPLLMQSNQRLAPFFASLCILAVTFFVPFLIGLEQVDKGRGDLHPILGFWPAAVLTFSTGLLLLWRLARR